MPTRTAPPPETETETSPWVEVAEFDSLAQAYDHGLVILAMGEACKVERDTERGTFALQAEPQPAPKIERELAAYADELSAPASARPFADWAPHDAGWPESAVATAGKAFNNCLSAVTKGTLRCCAKATYSQS